MYLLELIIVRTTEHAEIFQKMKINTEFLIHSLQSCKIGTHVDRNGGNLQK